VLTVCLLKVLQLASLPQNGLQPVELLVLLLVLNETYSFDLLTVAL
jgi:hypothetical protein